MIDLWQEIYGTIKRNKLRTFLTGFAVAWGIFMLIVLLGAGNGLMNAFTQNANRQALNSMQVWPGTTRLPYKGLKEGRNIKLTEKELDATQQITSHVTDAEAVIEQSGVNLSYEAEHVSITLKGVSPIHPQLEGIKMKEGRFINQPDMDERRKVIVLHEKTIEMLFGDKPEQVIGKYINTSGLSYRIVGIYTDQGSFTPSAFLPFTTLQLIYNKKDEFGSILFLTRNLTTEEQNDAFEQDYRRQISGLQQFDPEDSGALWIWNRFTQYLQQQTASNVLRIAIWVIGIFTLLSGVVGVSNIMLITVKERTHEFGIRKALGAKPRSILWLIIVESVTITTVFGYIGMLAGIGATEYMNYVAGKQVMDAGIFSVTVFENPTVDLRIAIQATLTLIIAGTLAGFFPARKAAMVRPIEALRAE
ncbi:MAG: ABC transporter permease [Bacteroides sp.]|nr:ABC transporter permease [Bacteroides sp.]